MRRLPKPRKNETKKDYQFRLQLFRQDPELLGEIGRQRSILKEVYATLDAKLLRELEQAMLAKPGTKYDVTARKKKAKK